MTEWMELAACRDRTDVDWYADEMSVEAAALCDACPVLRDCLAYALDRESKCDVGIWGGTTLRDRDQLRRRIGRKAMVR